MPPTQKPFRVQYISDIHLEHFKIAFEHDLNPKQFLTPDPSADLLVLAGDIGNPDEPIYRLFLSWCSKNWKKTVVVAGNHEFYNQASMPKRSIQDRLDAIRLVVSEFPNVHFLHREKLEVRPGLFVLGCTLWTDIPEEKRYDAMTAMSDYRNISATFDELKAWHKEDVAWLELSLSDLSGSAIVVTHHLPTFKAIARKFRGHPLNDCFATSLDGLIEVHEPLAWFCGHSHEGGEYLLGKTRVLLNPRGYPFEQVSTRDPRKIVDLKPMV